MSSRVEKAGSLRFKPTARTATASGGRLAGAGVVDKPVATPIRPTKMAAAGAAAAAVEAPQPVPLPIARRPSVGGQRDHQQQAVAGSSSAAATSALSPSARGSAGGGATKSVTKSYVGVKGGGGVPIFVGPNPPLSRAGSMAPPPPSSNSRRSQTPQLQSQSIQRRPSVPRGELVTPSRQVNGDRDGHRRGDLAAGQSAESSQQASSSSIIAPPPAYQPAPVVTNGKGKATAAALASASPSASSSLRRPANPPSAYVLFSQKVRPRLADEAATPEGASFNITARVRQEWTALTVAERREYQEDAAQRRQTWESLMDDYNASHPDEAAKAESQSQSQSKAALTRKPSRVAQGEEGEEEEPSRDAYEIFRREYSSTKNTEGDAELAWRGLTTRQRQKYELQAQLAEEEYLDKMLSEEAGGEAAAAAAGGSNGAKAERRSKKQARTISDDEAEYAAEVAEHGPALKARRVDSRSTSMADLSASSFKRGRASARTFDMERKLKEQARDRQRQLKRERAARVHGEAAEEGSPPPSDSEATSEGGGGGDEVRSAKVLQQQTEGEPEEEIIDEGEEEEEEEEEGGGAQSDVESVGTASEMMPALRDDRFTVRTRIVNGQIVLDESSLQQERSNQAGMDGVGQEYVDVNEEERFVNSATYSKRVGTERWDAQETRAFLEAVSMWGSDFEMISRMFPKRNRKQIRAKWRSLERTDSRSLDLAFKRKLPVNLEAYGLMAGVDLSGEVPQIEARLIKKAEGEGEEEEEGDQTLERQVEIERDEDGREIVDESDAPPRVIRKKSATPARLAKSKSPSVGRALEGDEEGEGEELPTEGQMVQSARSTRSRSERESSIVSATSHKTRANAGSATAGAPSSSSSAAPTAAAEAERQRQEKKLQDQQRKERERLRRRAVPSNAEEIVD